MRRHAVHSTVPQSPHRAKPAQRGFTLVELMVVLAVIGILSAVAYPSYVNSVAKGRRADAQKALLEAAQYMQRYYVANNRYTDSTDKPPVLPPTLSTTKSGSGGTVYNVAVAAASASDYTLKATPASDGLMSNDECGIFVLESSGRRALEGKGSSKKAGDCWR